MKKIAFIFLLFILLLQNGGMLIIYKIMQLHDHYEMQQKLISDKTPLQKLFLSHSTFLESKINTHEIFYKGEMYDLKEVSYKKGGVELLVILDKKEGKTMRHINDLASNAHHTDKKSPNRMLGMLFLICSITNMTTTCFIPQSTKNKFRKYNTELLKGVLEIPAPPPRCV